MNDTMQACPECGAEIQATVPFYWSFRNGSWVLEDISTEDMKIYCSDDCGKTEAADTDDSIYKSLRMAMRDFGLALVDNPERFAALDGMFQIPDHFNPEEDT